MADRKKLLCPHCAGLGTVRDVTVELVTRGETIAEQERRYRERVFGQSELTLPDSHSDESPRLLDLRAVKRFIERAAPHYEQLAPTVTAYLEALYLRLVNEPETVSVVEIQTVQALSEEGRWEDGNHAANRIYKMQDRLGRDTSGQLGY